MNIQPGKKYQVLKFPNLGASDLHTVKVLRLYTNPLQGTLVEYRYNWPFPITKQVTLNEFESWIATPFNGTRED